MAAAHTLESVLRSIQKGQFDAILLEFNLRSRRRAHPTTGNGVKLVRQLRALHVAVPILMFTAMAGEPYKSASLEAGADEFIPKTDGIPSLASRIRAHIRRHERDLKNMSARLRGSGVSRCHGSARTRRTVKAAE